MYKSEICEKEHTAIWEYVACVSKCAEELKKKEKAEAEKKRMEEVNYYLTQIKETKERYDDLCLEFANKFPEEYKLNFKYKCDKCNDYCSPIDEDATVEEHKEDTPIIRARVNGKSVDPSVLFEDPDCKYIAKLLGILD